MVVNSVKASEDLMIKNKAEMIEMLASKEWKKFELFIFENFRNCNNEELTRYNISGLYNLWCWWIKRSTDTILCLKCKKVSEPL